MLICGVISVLILGIVSTNAKYISLYCFLCECLYLNGV